MAKKNETPQEKEARLEKHKRYVQFIIKRFFLREVSDVFQVEYFVCRKCKVTANSSEEAAKHYFDNHWEKKVK